MAEVQLDSHTRRQKATSEKQQGVVARLQAQLAALTVEHPSGESLKLQRKASLELQAETER